LLLCGAALMPGRAQKTPAASGAAAPAAAKAVVLPADTAGIEFFETKVRPVLAQRCYSCHSHAAKTALGGLYLDSRQAMVQGGKRGAALMPGQPDSSLIVQAVHYTQPDLQMPPAGKLPEAVLADLTAWVKLGAPWPQEAAPTAGASAWDKARVEKEKRQREHWAWQPVRVSRIPAVHRKDWARNPIDLFILAALEARHLSPNPRADRRTLIRRATFDLIGLPPTPEEVDAFVADKSPDAWEKVVDRLLASPHYGERWGRYWLDVARYGEDQAHSFEPRLYPQGFRYRDWVAHALNADMPYDRFVKAQIAADLIDLNGPNSHDDLAALGFFATGPVYYGDSRMYDQYDDRVDTLSRGLLGLTVACARCHDHKFDPITQKDYYGLVGVFASTKYVEVQVASNAADGKSGPTGDRQKLLQTKSEEVDKFAQEQTAHFRAALLPETARYLVASWKLINRRKADPKLPTEPFASKEGVEPVVLDRWLKYLTAQKERPVLVAWRQMLKQQASSPDLTGDAPALAEAQRTAEAFQNAVLALNRRREAENKAAAHQNAPADSANRPLDKAEAADLNEIVGDEGVLTLSREQFEPLLTGDPKAHYAVIKAELERLRMGPFVHALSEGPQPGNVHVLLRGNPDTPGEEAPRRFLAILGGDKMPPVTHGSGRLELANAIADRNNPLTARVLVNRLWQHHFGIGLVRTASNFGLLGEPPTHPELLDYLAKQLVAHGWSQKALHRQIMLSATYQQSSARNPRGEESDPGNRYLARMPRRRLEVEAWRDAMLAVSGRLDLTLDGPSVQLSSADNCRRTFYAAISRHDLDQMLRLFDFPDPNVTAEARTTTTVPLQQLFVLNSEFMVRQAKAFAARLTANAGETDATRIQRAYLLAYGRPPIAAELRLGLAYLAGPSPGASVVQTAAAGAKAGRLSRWEQYAQALLSANEFLYID
jgi:cytochrome c553